ncbi:hypothetical protein [Corynebacterium sphenisci]|uniref:hypothetical protein n=1 Tax=Corynebacterium sphenisci TaxID=191493 RepID=UPI0026E0E344|nr:hypothetical protein [Corynebacterium sphenisci]MDO5730801.1 hypothetical protein [Corynebacterium sphenisci]
MTDRDHLTVVTAETIKPGDTLAYPYEFIHSESSIDEAEVHRATVERLTATQAVMTNGDRWMLDDLPRVNIRGYFAGGNCAAVFDGPDADTRARAATRANFQLTKIRRRIGSSSLASVVTNPDVLRTLIDGYWDAARLAWGEEAGQ